MKKFLVCAAVGLFFTGNAMAQGICLGLNCPGFDVNDFSSYQPGQSGGFATWNQYGDFMGLMAGLHMPPEMTVPECVTHCLEHSVEVVEQCTLDAVNNGAVTLLDPPPAVCVAAGDRTYLECTTQCIHQPH